MTSDLIPARTPTMFMDTPAPVLVAQHDALWRSLEDPSFDESLRPSYVITLQETVVEMAQRFIEFNRVAEDGLVTDDHLRTFARGVGVLDPESAPTEESEARRRVKEARKAEAEAKASVQVLRKRVELDSQQLAIHRNRGLGAAAPVAAALVPILASARPVRPGKDAGYRVPLGRLADATGLSEDACSRHLKKLSEYTLEDGTPVLHREVINVPAGVDSMTGETGGVTMPHKELYVGPGVTLENFAEVLAQLQPAEKPKWGGKREGTVCPDHPTAGVIKRTKTTVTVSFECAECNAELQKTNTVIGQPTAETMPEIPPHEITGWLDGTDEAQERAARSAETARHGTTVQSMLMPSAPTAEEVTAGLAAWSKAGDDTDADALTDVSIGARNRQRPGSNPVEQESYANSRLAQSFRRDSLLTASKRSTDLRE